ncbi:MAG: hypothetical protein E7456_06205 [Ruminococcaceae bacterium]|nr:hypothetical protein [Oscillospiraceae bacterium]
MRIISKRFLAGALAVMSAVSVSGVIGVLFNTEVTAVFAEKEQMWAVSVDGETVGACSTMEEASEVLQEFLDRYTTTDAESVAFLQDVELFEMNMDEDILTTADDLSRILDPESENSEYALDVLTEREVTEHRVTECEVEYYDTVELYRGELQVTREGTDREEDVTMRIEYLNGGEILRTDLYSTVTVEGEAQLVARGITEKPVTASYGEYIWPAEGVITSDFGYRTVSVGSSNHKGIDIAGEFNSDIIAADGGEVIFAGVNGGYGNMVKIRHDNGTVTFYAHCNSLCVSEGERVARGQTIARMGSTGVSTGTHLHFEVRVNDVAQDPVDYLP